MLRLSWWSCAICLALGLVAEAANNTPSHKGVSEIAVKGKDGCTLQTMALSADGKLAVLVAKPRYGDEAAKAATTSEVRLLDSKGGELQRWAVSFTGQSIAVGPDGAVYVGGEGQLAKFDALGKPLSTLELPHLKELLQDTKGLRERAVEMQKSVAESYKDIAQQFEDQRKPIREKVDELKKKPNLTAADKRRLERYEEQLSQLDETVKQFATPSVDDLLKRINEQVRTVNGVTVTARDVFVVTGESAGYGYAVWRMDHKFEGSRQILSGLTGCCGQMDVQAHGDELFVAENCNHRVGRFNRDGEKLAAFGQKTEKNPDEGFGGCCNPMNLRVGTDGAVYTAESEGIIRCFAPNGDYRGLVGKMALTGGCKNVAVAVSADGNRVYFCDQPGERIIVLSKDAAEGTDVKPLKKVLK